MVRLLIVDDEYKTRRTLHRHVPWHDLGISAIELAEDGVQAMRISAQFMPQIVLTDVRMPRMNGLELAGALREVNPACKVIFLSAYTEVEYLKNAIKLHAFDYVEKPIDPAEIGEVVAAAAASFRDSRDSDRPAALEHADHARILRRDEKPLHPLVAKIAAIIQEQAGSPNLTINSIAAQLFLTPTYLCMIFKNETGLTINQFVTRVRVETAKRLIARHKVNVVCGMVGYTDTKHFTKIFKKEVGVTPTEYKRGLRP